MEKTTLAWLAGLLEGEGSFLAPPPSKPNDPRIGLEMTDEDVIARVAALVGLRYVKPTVRNVMWRQGYRITIRGARAREIMELIRPMMSQRRKSQIDRALAGYDPDFRYRTRLLSGHQGREIRRRVAAGESVTALAREFSVSTNVVYSIRAGRSYC